jgi:hypothetical protein
MPRLRFDAASVQRYQQLFGPEHGPVMVALSADLRILFIECEQWERLFGSPAAVEILNQAAPSVAWLLQETLYDQILLDLAKLVDPVRSTGKANMTLRLLPGVVPEAARAGVDSAVTEACTAAEFAKENRHKRLAHSDLAQRLGNHERLSRGSLDQVRDAVFACAAAYAAA